MEFPSALKKLVLPFVFLAGLVKGEEALGQTGGKEQKITGSTGASVSEKNTAMPPISEALVDSLANSFDNFWSSPPALGHFGKQYPQNPARTTWVQRVRGEGEEVKKETVFLYRDLQEGDYLPAQYWIPTKADKEISVVYDKPGKPSIVPTSELPEGLQFEKDKKTGFLIAVDGDNIYFKGATLKPPDLVLPTPEIVTARQRVMSYIEEQANVRFVPHDSPEGENIRAQNDSVNVLQFGTSTEIFHDPGFATMPGVDQPRDLGFIVLGLRALERIGLTTEERLEHVIAHEMGHAVLNLPHAFNVDNEKRFEEERVRNSSATAMFQPEEGKGWVPDTSIQYGFDLEKTTLDAEMYRRTFGPRPREQVKETRFR